MLTTVLAVLLSAAGVAGIIAGAHQLARTRLALRERPFNTAVAAGAIVGGLGLLGLAQALRLLLVINGKLPG